MLKRSAFLLILIPFLIQDKKDSDKKQDQPVVLKVGIEKATVQEKPSSFSKVLEILFENDEVTVLEVPEEGVWVKVKVGNKVGYMTKGAIMEEETKIKTTKGVSTETIRKVSEQGAGKAFSQKIEDKYKDDATMKKNYEKLDKFMENTYLEKRDRSKLIDDVSNFIKEGKLE